MEFEYFSGVFSETTENIVTSTPIQTIINPGADVLVVEVPTFSDVVTKCQLTRPQGYIIEFKPNDGSHERFQKLDDTDVSRCRARVDIENVGDDGLWTLTATSDEGRVRVQQYNVTLNHTEYTGKIQFYSSKNNTSLQITKSDRCKSGGPGRGEIGLETLECILFKVCRVSQRLWNVCSSSGTNHVLSQLTPIS